MSGAAPDALIVRAAWLYSPHGANFLKTMLRLMGERGEVRVVTDRSARRLRLPLWPPACGA